MPQNKQGRLCEDMKRVVVEIIREMKDPRLQTAGLLTVTRVAVTPDLANAKVYISVLGSKENATEQAVTALRNAAGHVRTEVSRRMHIRRSPEFAFVEDNGAAYAAHINDVIEGLK
ncbi:MAG: 30S ribosome-binding factor RbfA [Oscillospiraceae bacterium]